MFAEGMDGYKGGMSSKKYEKLVSTSEATARRDLQALVELGVFVRTGDARATRYWLNLGDEFDGPRMVHLAEQRRSRTVPE